MRIGGAASYQLIADELNALGIPHYLGKWTDKLVRSAMYRMRTKSVYGLGLLPAPQGLADHVAALHDRGLDESRIAEEVRNAGVRTQYAKSVSEATVQYVLTRLGRMTTPPSARLPGNTLLDAALHHLWEETRSIADVTRRANEQGIRTSRGNPWRISGMARKLASLGAHSPKKRGPYRSHQHAEGRAGGGEPDAANGAGGTQHQTSRVDTGEA
jgi:hypothetical protein